MVGFVLVIEIFGCGVFFLVVGIDMVELWLVLDSLKIE